MGSTAGINQTVISLALNKIQPDITNNIFAQIPFWEYLRSEGNVSILDGGERISYPLMHATNSTAASYTTYDIIDTTPQEGVGDAQYVWRQYAVSASVAGREQRQVAGSARIVDIVKAKNDQAIRSLANKLNTDAFAAQTGNNLDGLQTLVADSPSSGTIGGIAASNTFWQNYQASGASSSTAFDNLLARMRTGFNTTTAAANGLGSPDLYITTRTVYEGYEGLADSKHQYGNEKLLNLGFVNLAYKTAGVLFDNAAPSGKMYILNTKTLKLVMHQDAQMTVTEAVKPANQDAIVWQYLFMGNMVILNRATNGVITSIT